MTGLNPLEPRNENLTDLVFDSIREAIVDQTLPPGSRVSEQRIASQLNVSKTPVREGLLRLRHIGLVKSFERGLRVVTPSVHAIRNAYEFRAGIERTAAYYAAHRADNAQREELMKLARTSLDAATAGNALGFRASDRAFHRLIATAADNDVLIRAVEDTLTLTTVLRERDVPSTGDSVSCAHEHIAIAQHILAGAADEAQKEAGDHVLHVMSLVLAAHTALAQP
ncbi:GntR family transcriptional regulator [Saccharopolyspora spinosa]|uniref:GntR family transcriptional regulator n=1 Tax=Saccharopolyspora spinosa TaxID=60894 RepID=A0A2N3Y6E5_SACSN|nr:GntR family transcriptional regulator [Saccharopolyspora spinosa]PKW18497.1 GntR family transcriptional regulator [Saccharopolyspora spinosa]